MLGSDGMGVDYVRRHKKTGRRQYGTRYAVDAGRTMHRRGKHW